MRSQSSRGNTPSTSGRSLRFGRSWAYKYGCALNETRDSAIILRAPDDPRPRATKLRFHNAHKEKDDSAAYPLVNEAYEMNIAERAKM